MDRAQLFQRHDLVWLTDDAIPWVVTRRSLAQVTGRELALGRCLPAPPQAIDPTHPAAADPQRKPTRQAATAPEREVLRWRPALTVAEVLHRADCLPETWIATLQALLPLQVHFGASLRVFGSAAWQVLGGGGYLRPASDLDLLVCLPDQAGTAEVQALCFALDAVGRASVQRGGPPLDGELRLPGHGDLSWREWLAASASGDRVLMKDAVAVRLVQMQAKLLPPAGALGRSPEALDRLACAALREEAGAWPKPGLVSPVDQGSHADMDIDLLLRAIAALEGWFACFARAALAGAEFADLAALGRAAELAMLQATGGVNAYRGAIFNLGLLVAASAIAPAGEDPCLVVAQRWSADLRTHQPPADSHGQRVRQREGAGGALRQAAEGFPVLRQTVLPAYRQAQALGLAADRCMVAACLAGIAVLEDTNLLWRGGREGLQWAQAAATQALAAGGVLDDDWCARLAHLHAEFVARRLSPGGSADLAGCAAYLAHLDQRDLHAVNPG